MDRRDQNNFNIAFHKFFSPHELYAHFPSPCPPDCAGKIPLPTAPPEPVAAPPAHPTCPTPACLIPAHQRQKAIFSDQQYSFFSRCPGSQKERLTAEELARHIDIARKCIKYHYYPDTDQTCPTNPEHASKTVAPLPPPITAETPSPSQELGVKNEEVVPQETVIPSSLTTAWLRAWQSPPRVRTVAKFALMQLTRLPRM